MIEISPALLQSLIAGPLLLADLPEAPAFSYHRLTLPKNIAPLNLEQKLGHLYEEALAQLLESSPAFDLLAKNLQIQKDQHTTVGELDFLLRDLTTGQLIHLELATKFYLAVHSPEENTLTLPGPDARDNYFKKLARLRTHQLQLPTLFKGHLPPEFRDETIVTQNLVYGCLFDHITATTPAAPEHLNPSCRRGKWLTREQLPDYFPEGTTFQIIPKPLWPVPLELLPNTPLETWSPEKQITRCLMVRVEDHPTPYFIAPPGYPEVHQSSSVLKRVYPS